MRTFDPTGYPDPRSQPADRTFAYESDLLQYGAFASLDIDMSEHWSATAGARVATDYTRIEAEGFVDLSYGNSHVITPLFGLMYRIKPGYSLYASYADVYYSPSTSERASGSFFGAEHGVNIEAGAKAAWRDGALNGSVALYRIRQTGIPDYDPAAVFALGRAACCFTEGSVSSRGLELQLDGEVQPGWLIGGGYSYNVRGDAVALQQELASPHHQLKAWTSVRLPGALALWTLGGDLEAQSLATATGQFYCSGGCAGLRPTQKAYAVADLRAALQLDSHWQVALQLNNVLDKIYFESVSETSRQYFYGQPRNFTVRLDGKF